jgi:hypothetical protein
MLGPDRDCAALTPGLIGDFQRGDVDAPLTRPLRVTNTLPCIDSTSRPVWSTPLVWWPTRPQAGRLVSRFDSTFE